MAKDQGEKGYKLLDFLRISEIQSKGLWFRSKEILYVVLIDTAVFQPHLFVIAHVFSHELTTAYALGRGVNREGFNFKLAMVKMCFTWPLLNKYAL